MTAGQRVRACVYVGAAMNPAPGPRLPRPGLAWGAYPQRDPSHQPAATAWWSGWLAAWPLGGVGAAMARQRLKARMAAASAATAPSAASPASRASTASATPDATAGLLAALPLALAESFLQAQAELARHVDADALGRCRQALHRHGLNAATAGPALALAAHHFAEQLGLRPYPTQLLAAWLLLQSQFAEMATGEGKTLAMGLAAAVAALGGAPVHVLTANDYLAARDQAMLAPAYAALGLTSAAVTAKTPPEERSAAYRCPIVHSTAREIGFDYLRDHLLLGGQRDPRTRRAAALAADSRAAVFAADSPAAALAAGGRGALSPAPLAAAAHPTAAEPLLPGLCFALLDEADSLLLDEATVPLLLAQPGAPLQPAEWHAAWAIAAALREGLHFELRPELQRAELTGVGHAAVGERSNERTALRRRIELVQAALVARHLLKRDRHYTLTPGGIELIDEPTGRRAEGRRWAGHLYPMVQLKEGLPPSAPAVTAAQITYPRLFSRYLALAGMSGTLLEARRELLTTYGKRVRRVPLAQPDRRRWLGTQLFVHAGARDAAVARRAAELSAAARPTLIGTDSVAAAQALSRRLQAAGVAHRACMRCTRPKRSRSSPPPAAPAASRWPPISPAAAPISGSMTRPRPRVACTSSPPRPTAHAASTANSSAAPPATATPARPKPCWRWTTRCWRSCCRLSGAAWPQRWPRRPMPWCRAGWPPRCSPARGCAASGPTPAAAATPRVPR